MQFNDRIARQLQTSVAKDEFDTLKDELENGSRFKPTIYIMISPAINACDYYRGTMVERELRKYDMFNIKFIHGVTPKEIYDGDLVIVYRPKDRTLMGYVQDPSAQNARIMADYDDDVFSVPRGNFLAPNFMAPDKQASLQIVSRVHQLTVSTRRLRGLLQSHQSKVSVIPNTIDFKAHNDLLMKKPTKPNERYRIGWAGTYTHTEDLMGGDQVFLRALSDFMRKYRDTEMCFFGLCPESFMQEFWGRVQYAEPIHLYQYMQRLSALNLDLMVYPLANHQFNHSKSNIRWLESSMLHVPVIASDIPSYKEIGEPLCRTVPLTHEAWFTALEHAYKNREEMRKRAELSREWIREHWSIQAMAPAWAAVYRAAARGESLVQDFTPPTYQSLETRVSGDMYAGPDHEVPGRESMKKVEKVVGESTETTKPEEAENVEVSQKAVQD